MPAPRWGVFVVALCSLFSLSSTARAETIRVGAAISLKEAMADVAKTYEADSGDHVEFSFGSSGQILAQIRGGADLDAFLSAANKQVDDLQKEKLVDPASRRIVAENALVLIVPSGAKYAPTSFEALGAPSVARVAMGEPKSVPAGQYAQQVLNALKLTGPLAGHLVYGTNVRQVLAYVERGEVSAGIVYATDAMESGDKIRVVASADERTHEPIVYPGVILSASKKPAAARRFLDYLASDKARAALRTRGFKAGGESATRPAAP